jgi:hypothetical protein
MLNRLNGWQRIGVVLTGLWVALVLCVVAGTDSFVTTIPGQPPSCSAPAPESSPDKKTFSFEEAFGCAPGAIVAGTPDSQHFNWRGLMFAIAAVPVGVWLLIYLLIHIIRWVAQGFRRRAT